MNTARFAEAYTRRYGLHIVPLPPRTKRPVTEDWGNDVISDPEAAEAYFVERPDWNIGVALGPSRLCSLDVDDIEAMTAICEEFGIDLEGLRSANPTIQGAAKGFRIMFRVPDGVSLQYHSLTWPKQDGSKGRFTVFELRAACDGKQRQDVFPPSIHPDTGKPYVWLTRPNGEFPAPPDWLITIWNQWDKFKPQLQDVCPWVEKTAPPEKRSIAKPIGSGESVIQAYVASRAIEDALTAYGYARKGRRWLSPHSGTGLPGVNVFPDGRAWIHHASDPLCSDESGRPVNSFDLYCYYEHNGDLTKAVRAAADALGMKPEPRRRSPPAVPPGVDPETGEILEQPQATVGDNGASSSRGHTSPSGDAAATKPAGVPVGAGIPAAGVALWEELGLAVTDKGAVLMNLDNVVRAIEADPTIRGHIWYDEFLDSIVTDWQGPQRKWKDADDVKLALYMQRHVGLHRIGVQTCHDAALVAAFHDTRNECKEWLQSRQWDGVPRVGHLMAEGFGADDNPYTEAVGRCWCISMVARVFHPGCKVDTVPVLEGSQGAGKSSGLAILGGKWFVEGHESVMTKDFFGVLQGHMLVEISEMHSFSRAEVERIKGIISCQVDRYRKAYGRNTEDHPRQTVLVCTTNRDDWQKDDTGARRFWPVRCGQVDHEWLRRNRDQLFAEAVRLYLDGVSWWDVPNDRQQEEVEDRRDADSWEPVVQQWLEGRTRMFMHDLLSDCLKIEIGRHDQMIQKRVGRILRVLGWQRKTVRDSGRISKAWIRVA